MNIKKLFKLVSPPIFIRIINSIRNKFTTKLGIQGNYLSWDKAKNLTTGYDSKNIINVVKNALLRVKNGEAEHERDGKNFDKIYYSWPLLSFLMLSAVKNKGKLNIIDWGGSLGTTYFQNRKFIKKLKNVKWNIVEQKNFVKCGKIFFQDNELKFYNSVEEVIKYTNPNAIIFSSVLQYIEYPFKLLDDIFFYNFDYLTPV